MSEKLTPQQIQAAQMLAKGHSTHSITFDLKICPDTLYRWKKIKEFKELVNEIITDELAETKFRMAHIVDASLSALWDLVTDGKESNRLQAAMHVLKLAGVMHIPSPNVTQTVEYILKPEAEEQIVPPATPPVNSPG